MDDFQSPMNSTNDLAEQVASLRRLTFSLLLALIVVSGTLTVYLFRQASLARRDIAQTKQLIQNLEKNRVALQSFLQQLAAYGQTHPDFQQKVLNKYGITPQALTPPKK